MGSRGLRGREQDPPGQPGESDFDICAESLLPSQSIFREHIYCKSITNTRLLRLLQGGYTWSITFSTAIGNPPQIAVEDHLTGIGHNVTSATFQDGNVLTGTYTIAFFGGVTRQIPVTASEGELETILNVSERITVSVPVPWISDS